MTKRYISSIRIENFGAFYNSGYKRILLPKGENVLVYGENGSGKSSLYKALSQFFDSSENNIHFNINLILPNQPGFVEICFTNEVQNENQSWSQISSDIFRFNSGLPSNNQEPFIRQANRIRGFLSYQQLVKTYTLPTSKGETPNIYSLVIEDLLWHHKLRQSNKTVQDFSLELSRGLALMHAGRRLFKSAVEDLPIFNHELNELFHSIILRVNYWLQHYFQHKVEISVETLRISLNPSSYEINKELYLRVSHFGNPFLEYHNFLNEARLSAIAIGIYLAGIKLNPTGSNYKLLFLDDIFIGLDTANRLPLLRILNEEFSDFQIFITTYDRNWFELAKEQLNYKKWRLIEMFHENIEIDNNGEIEIIGEKPVIIESSFNFLEKANQYYKTKDYPASANYLRKETERILRKLLPLERRINIDENFGSRDETKLEVLLNSFNSYIKDCNIILPAQTIDAIKLYKTLVLNPQSHNDIQSPVYRVELEKTFAAIEELSSIGEINKSVIVSIGCHFIYQNKINHNYSMELELVDNIYKVECGANTTISKYKFRIVNWIWNGTQYATKLTGSPMADPRLTEFTSEKRTLREVFDIITFKEVNPLPNNLEQSISLANITLHQLLI